MDIYINFFVLSYLHHSVWDHNLIKPVSHFSLKKKGGCMQRESAHSRKDGQVRSAEPAISYKAGVADIRMAILPDGYLDKLFSSEQSDLIPLWSKFGVINAKGFPESF